MLEKIKKLLALAQDPSAAPQEAENAARMAAKLMAKHEISQADLDLVQLAREVDLSEGYAKACRPGKKNPKVIPAWINMIAVGVMRFTRARMVMSGPNLIFRGPRQDVELACWLHEYLVTQCYKVSEGRSISEANAFRNSFAGAVQKRLKDLANIRSQEEGGLTAGESTALAVVQDRLKDLMDQKWGPDSTRIKSARHPTSAEGREAGMNAHIPTNRPVGSQSTTPRLK